VITDLVSAVVVLAAFGAGLRWLAGRAFGRAPGMGRLRVPGRRGMVTIRLSRGVAWAVVLAARFACGAPLGRRRTDATFLSAGTRALSGVPGWFTTAEPGRWAYLPGWQRAAARWAAVAVAAGLAARPLVTGAVLGWLAVLAGFALAPRIKRRRYVRRVIRPVYLQLCQYLGTDPADWPGRWLDIPAGFAADPGAVITLAYPATWNPDTARQAHIDGLIRRHLGADLVPSFSAFTATWRHPAAPPERAPFDGYDLPAHKIHLATLPGGAQWIADLQDEEPHLFIAAGTGGGKTSTASVPAAHVRAHGWLVDIIDPKRRSYIDRKTGNDVLTNVPGIRVHTDIESMMWALEEFFLSMLGINIAVGARSAWPGAFPQRLLVIDEFGTFAGMAARMHRRAGQAGPSPALDQRRQIEWQGRQAGHRLVLAVHQPNLRLFGDSDSRGQYGYRLITGAYTTSLWRMTFGLAPRIEWDARIKGRGVVGVGEAENLIHAAQLTWMPAEERRRYALTGPPPPQWFTDMRPAPWIDGHVISEGRKLAGVSLVDVPLVGVPPGQDIHVPAQTRRHVPPDVPPPDTGTRPLAILSPAQPARPAGRHRAPASRVEQPVTSTGGTGRHHAAAPAQDTAAAPAGEMITGIAAAARYLGYRNPDSFRRARTRRPIPGETKTHDGRPCWTPGTLRSWQSTRKIAGHRTPGSEPD
jgi:hypothetical protein